MALAILADAAFTAGQFYWSYFTLHSFDVAVGDVMYVLFCLFLPTSLLGALMMRACIQRIRLALWVRKAIKIAEYATILKPAEAGFLCDYEYSHRELTATLVDLHMRGVIVLKIDDKSGTVSIGPAKDGAPDPSAYENTVLNALDDAGLYHFSSFTDYKLIEAAMPAQDMLLTELEYHNHAIKREHLPNKQIRKVFRVLYWIAGGYGVLTVYGAFTAWDTLTSIAYPRYPVTASELIIFSLAIAIITALLISSCWPRFVHNHHDPRYQAWMDAAGFLLYMQTVYGQRFAPDNITSQDTETLRTFAPYAIAYGIISTETQDIAQLLAATDQAE